LTTRFIWTECLKKLMLMPNEVTSSVKGVKTEFFAPRPFEVIYFLMRC